MLFQSFLTLCTYVDLEVTHMINGLRPSPSIVAYCKHQKLGSEKGEEFPLETAHGSLVPSCGGGGGEKLVSGNDANFISQS